MFKPVGFDSPYKKHRWGENEHALLRMHMAQDSTEEEIVEGVKEYNVLTKSAIVVAMNQHIGKSLESIQLFVE